MKLHFSSFIFIIFQSYFYGFSFLKLFCFSSQRFNIIVLHQMKKQENHKKKLKPNKVSNLCGYGFGIYFSKVLIYILVPCIDLSHFIHKIDPIAIELTLRNYWNWFLASWNVKYSQKRNRWKKCLGKYEGEANCSKFLSPDAQLFFYITASGCIKSCLKQEKIIHYEFFHDNKLKIRNSDDKKMKIYFLIFHYQKIQYVQFFLHFHQIFNLF